MSDRLANRFLTGTLTIWNAKIGTSAQGGLRAFTVRPLPRPEEAFTAAIRYGSKTEGFQTPALSDGRASRGGRRLKAS